ncbi:MAG: penicillin acylase family protein [Nannocystales bacterium]
MYSRSQATNTRTASRALLAALLFIACSPGPATDTTVETSSSVGTTTDTSSNTDPAESFTTTGGGAETASTGSTEGGDSTVATLRRTTHGVVHVESETYFGLGYGVGYAYTEDNRCLLAHRIEEVQGRLSAQLGADAPVTNAVHDTTVPAIRSDQFYRGWLDDEAIVAGFEAGDDRVIDLAEGYAAGINRYLVDNPNRPLCAVEFSSDVTAADLYRIWVAAAMVGSGEALVSLLAQAPPSAASPLPPSVRPRPLPAARAGSNAWAIGRDATLEGSSVHLYNPHFPWSGSQRLYLIHASIPGEVDVMGPALGGFPLPAAGFTRDIAWGLTFSNAARHTQAELALTDDPMRYVVDGAEHSVDAAQLSIEVAGEAAPRQVPFYRAQGRPLLDAPAFGMGWSTTSAFAVRDVNATNTRMVEQLLHIAQASTVLEVESALEDIRGIPWSYVVASDAAGDVWFGDVSAIPNVPSEQVTECVTTPTAQLLLTSGFVLLDGTRSACDWEGLLPASASPRVVRSDYVANSNNAYDRPHADTLLSGFSPVFGVSGEGLGLRPSLGLHMIHDRLSGDDGLGEGGFTPELARAVFAQTRNRGGELLAADIVSDCEATPTGEVDGTLVDLSGVCAALQSWDRRNGTASTGAAVFRGLWMAMQGPERMFEVPASIEEPLTTPSGYTTDPAIRAEVRDTLARVALAFDEHGVAPDAPWGSVNALLTAEGPIAVPGGLGREGVFDVNASTDGFYAFDGWVESLDGFEPPTVFGASYLHAVQLGADAPKATGVLAYSQATEPDSPWFLDQTERWSAHDWFEFPFTSEQIESDANLTTLEL